jgi:hypothetical protein
MFVRLAAVLGTLLVSTAALAARRNMSTTVRPRSR